MRTIKTSILVFMLASCAGILAENKSKAIKDQFNYNLDSNSQLPPLLTEAKEISDFVISKGPHHINTTADEYLPILNPQGNKLYFTGMDRTGYFDFKIDFTKVKNSGGEDVYYNELKNGVWSDARPINFLNTNSHESITDVKRNGDLIICGNYPENLGPSNEGDNGSQTTDIFIAKKNHEVFQINHLSEPINSIFNEFDAVANEDLNYMLFCSDRPSNIGDYHKKGWLWQNNRWGNTDIYISIKNGDEWQKPINLGKNINTSNAERSPWLSKDGLTLYISSNGYENKNDLDIYYFKRKDKKDWTKWSGPYPIKNINTENDEWGYKEYENKISIFSRATPFEYEITQNTRSGDAGIKETNFRSGYKLYGAQSAALNKKMNTDIYFVTPNDKPQFNISDIFFQFNKYDLKPEFSAIASSIADFCKQNPEKLILIVGHTDNIGDENYNLTLSNERAKSVQTALTKLGVKNKIEFKGLGPNQPFLPNTSDENRKKNRRVEIFLK